jgi:hypothetical protein
LSHFCLSSDLKIGVTLAFFHESIFVQELRDKLKMAVINEGAIISADISSILAGMLSIPVAFETIYIQTCYFKTF